MKKTSLLFGLYFCQGLPGGFLAVALPVMIRQSGAGYTLVGFSTLLSIPWLIKFLWAPFADRFYNDRFGRRKSWIVPAQTGMLLVTFLLAIFEGKPDILSVAILFLFLNLFASIQDIGVDGLAVDILGKQELGAGNAAQISGFKIGNLIGGGVLLSLVGVIGWRGSFFAMAVLIALVITLLMLINERGFYVPDPSRDEKSGRFRELLEVFRQLGPGFWTFLFFAKFGETFGGALVKPLLVDLGFTLGTIGLLDGVIGGISTICGAIFAGTLYRTMGLKRTFALCAVLQGAFLIIFGIASRHPLGFTSAAVLNGLENFSGGGVGVCVFALAMSVCRRSVGAGQFTLSQCIYMSGAFAAAPLSGIAADSLSPLCAMVAGGMMTISLAPILLLTRLGIQKR